MYTVSCRWLLFRRGAEGGMHSEWTQRFRAQETAGGAIETDAGLSIRQKSPSKKRSQCLPLMERRKGAEIEKQEKTKGK